MNINPAIKNTIVYRTLRSLKNKGIKATVFKIMSKTISFNKIIKNKLKTKDKLIIVDNSKEIINQVNNNYISKVNNEKLVSIIIVSKDGIKHLKRLFKAVKENTIYKNFEIIVVDNASTDKTIEFLENNQYNFNIKIIKNPKNETFSYANNQASKIAKGEYLLFLNNDTEPLNGWLSHLVVSIEKGNKIGLVGSQLIYPYMKDSIFSTKVQHAGIAFEYEIIDDKEFFRPYNIGIGKTPIIRNQKLSIGQRIAITGACMLVKKDIFFELNGFDEKYNYGYEDVDFALKLHKKGYKSYYVQNSIIFHYESSTQNREKEYIITQRRESNINLLYSKWNSYIKQNFFLEKFKNRDKLFSEKKLTIAFAVTEAGDNVSAGDYFTALELADSFKSMGYNIVYLQRRKANWYNIPKGIDILISMLDAYDLNKIKQKNLNLITIAWIRNWPDRWLKNSSFNKYSMIFASSQTLCNIIKEKSSRDATLFPIATSPEKFIKSKNVDKSFNSDYSFTGNYWGVPREIEKFLNPLELDFKFSIYGKDWDQVDKFKEYHKGFLKYKNIPKVYANSKMTIDDAVVGVTKPYGSVNSRVFDAIAGGTLVLTNGIVGAKETFGDLLPVYDSKNELHSLLNEYLNDHTKRKEKIERLQKFINNHHTYRIRAQLMKQKLEEFIGIKKSIVIKMPIPNWNEAKMWGDYHLALGLQKEFEIQGYSCLLQILPEWDNQEGNNCDIVLVLRGLSEYKIKKHQLNLMWNISHPDKVSNEEYNSYDIIFVASDIWADKLKNILDIKVEVMHQCTDPNIFKPNKDKNFQHEILFLGNSRKVFRKALKYLLPTKYNLSVYGTLWEDIIEEKYIQGKHVENKEVYKYYANADIVLNDHWDSMRENGFISNRIFDVLACNGFILTDDVGGLQELFGNSIITYSSKDELENKIKYYLENIKERELLSKKGRDLVLEKHTYKNRVEYILDIIKV